MLRSFCAGLFFLVVLPVEAQAYRTFTDLPELEVADGAAVAWQAFPIDLEITEHPDAPVDGETTSAAVERAAGRWNDAMCTRDIFGRISLTDLAANDDGYNTVHWVTSNWAAIGEGRAVATTSLQYEERGGRYVLTEADIFLNADTVEWSDDMIEHLDGVIAHELGHALGLAHPCEPDGDDGAPDCEANDAMTLMHPLYDPARAELGGDDEDGACFLYPEGPIEAPPAREPESEGGCAATGASTQSSSAVVTVLLALGILSARRPRR